MKTSSVFEVWNKLAEAYRDRFMDLDLYEDCYEEFCALLPQDASVFETGCGPGNITRFLLRKRPDLAITATDLTPNMVALAGKLVPGASFEVFDCRNLDQLDRCFDAMVSGFCIPYLNRDEVCKLIKDTTNKMDSGGIFYLSAIEGAYESSSVRKSSDGKQALFVYLYESGFLASELQRNGFSLVREFRKQYNGSETHLILIAKKD